MITFPTDDYVKTRWYGYFWNKKEQKLYSLKVTGTLRPLSLQPAYCGYKGSTRVNIGPHYQLSVRGRRKCVTLEELKVDYNGGSHSGEIDMYSDVYRSR